jgi:hypothetical protein
MIGCEQQGQEPKRTSNDLQDSTKCLPYELLSGDIKPRNSKTAKTL